MRIFIFFLCALYSSNALLQTSEQELPKLPKLTHNPQLCYDFFRNLTNSSYVGPNVSVEVNNFLLFSGHNLNDLGDYESCSQIDTQVYTVASLYGAKVTYSMGICGPIYCNLTDLQNNTNSLIQFISDMSDLDLSSYSVSFVNPDATVPSKGVWLYFTILVFCALIVLTVWGTISGNRKQPRRTSSGNITASQQEERKDRIIIISPLLINRDTVGSRSRDNSENYSQARTESLSENSILLRKVLESFDVSENFMEIIKTEFNSTQDPNLDILNGIRVIAFFFVVYGHSFMYTITTVKNYSYVPVFMKSGWLLTVFGSLYAVDIFFYLGGFLSGFLMLSKLQDRPIDSNIYFRLVFHRWIRLWPAYCVAILFYWKLAVYVGDGPLWNNFVGKAEYCTTSAWQNLIFMDNVLAKDYECFNWGWYLACDFQIFLLLPLICWTYINDKEKGGYTILGLIVVSVIASYIFCIKTGVNFLPIAILEAKDTTNFMQNFYPNPIVRMSTSLIGLWFGILFKEYRDGDTNLFTWIKGSTQKSVGSFIGGIILMLYLIFYPRRLQEGAVWSDAFAMTWNIFGRLLWAVGLFFVTAPCLVGNLKHVRTFLRWRIFNAMAKASYGGYLLHLIVLQIVVYGNDQYYSLSEEGQTRLAFFVFMVSSVGGLILQLLIEKPIINIEAKLLHIQKESRLVSSGDKASVVSNHYNSPITFHGAT